MKIDLSQFRQTFMQESAEHISSMEDNLLTLRSNPGDAEILNAIFRSAHSIKGGAGSFGLTNLVRFTHALENLLERLRAFEIPATDKVIAVLLESVDVLRALLEAGAEGAMPANAPALVARIEAASAGESEGAIAVVAHTEERRSEERTAENGEWKMYRVELRPHKEMFSSGTNPVMLLRNLAALGTVGVCKLHAEKLPELASFDPAHCYLSWTVELATGRPEEELREVFEFVEHMADITIERVDKPAQAPALELAAPAPAAIVAPAQAAAAAKPVAVVPATSAPATIEVVTPAQPAAAAAKTAAAKKPAAGGESIRVATEKVDRLIDLVGELVIAQVMTAQMVEEFTPSLLPKLRESVAAMERNTRELHERVMAVRMMPVGSLFQRYQRTVYDIANSTGKQIKLETAGEETEIDKSMLEQLGDPLTHLIRNSADHGVESAEVRRAAGKPEEGTIGLRAFHRSGKVVIEVSDDGAGINPDRVRKKAIERGLIPVGSDMSDDQVRMLIFEPGFSTKEEVSDLSGRGVGMDVVKRNIQRLNGTVMLASQTGKGSTVSIELPLTLAILEGLLVRVADRTLVLPLLAVVETVSPKTAQIRRVAEQGEVVVVRDESVPLLRLSRFLGLPQQTLDGVLASTDPESRTLVVIVENERKKIGLVVDELLGQQQVVLKSLERHLHKVQGLMGATILGDGRVAPIVDVAGIASMDLFSIRAPLSNAQRKLPAALTNAAKPKHPGMPLLP